MGTAGALGYIGARGREGSLFSLDTALFAAEPQRIILSSNENPLGPGRKVLDAVQAAFGPGGATPGRYPGDIFENLSAAIARKFGVKRENVLLGTGSTQILRTATHVFTSKTAGLVATIPTYEECAQYAELMGSPVKGVALDSQFKMDLDAMAAASKGAGMVFYCNPNNPVATAVGKKATEDYLTRLLRDSPGTSVLVDEAYFDYATDPSYGTMIPMAVNEPRVVVARTFSKAYGMAGLRIGYAIGHAATIKKMAAWDGVGNINVLAAAAALSAIEDQARIDQESVRNKAARDFAMDWFSKKGYTPTDSQTNFLFVNIKRPAREFRDACRASGVLVARDFPPFEKTHCRISIGTMEEMQKAVEVFGKVLAAPARAAA
jgi:histidinol-phosphate aminotransferase